MNKAKRFVSLAIAKVMLLGWMIALVPSGHALALTTIGPYRLCPSVQSFACSTTVNLCQDNTRVWVYFNNNNLQYIKTTMGPFATYDTSNPFINWTSTTSGSFYRTKFAGTTIIGFPLPNGFAQGFAYYAQPPYTNGATGIPFCDLRNIN